MFILKVKKETGGELFFLYKTKGAAIKKLKALKCNDITEEGDYIRTTGSDYTAIVYKLPSSPE